MSFTVTGFANYKKAKNSTAIPTRLVDPAENFECVIKDPCTVLYPVIGFDFNGWDYNNVVQYNYFQIETFGRYYFVSDWEWSGGLWWAHLSVDVMGSWRDKIKAMTEYVLRSENESMRNGDIVDNIYPATRDISYAHQSPTLYSATNLRNGTYVMGIANGGRYSRGGITYVCGSQDDFSNLFKFLYGTTDWLNGPNITDISNDLLKCLVDPGQYIKSMMWFPFTPSEMEEEGGEEVGAGWWETDISLYYVHSTIEKMASVPRPGHPARLTRGNYLNYSPYTQLEAFVPGFGNVPLPTEKFDPEQNILFDLKVDGVSGTGSLFIHQSNRGYAEGVVLKGQIGVPLSVTTMMSDVLGGVSTITNAMANGTNSLAAATIGVIGGVADAAKLLSPDVTVIGGNGNISEYKVPPLLTATFHGLVDSDPNHMGWPVCRREKLGNLSGYCVIGDATVTFECYDSEKTEIISYMEGGFYIV